MKDRSIFIHAALDCINKIETYISGYTEEKFLSESKTQDVVIEKDI